MKTPGKRNITSLDGLNHQERGVRNRMNHGRVAKQREKVSISGHTTMARGKEKSSLDKAKKEV